MRIVTGKLAESELHLSELDFKVVHQTSVKHQAVDALSRFSMPAVV